ncbi:PLP-dependent aminotransferase family protein [Acidaminobacter sp. JC074]|uniref:aminotransferase-like domain-containing protein n=1 Tax=Acidaminobacter sp. JC074 TaxID=2530199 RepID=UPI001F0D2D28|nr:PLP-dependent aminotransferase family protein [Acidaminobacter sp. JC074]MCH4889107.1 PLP-dependent aminotransferase family protein [Acidaminobacter sp. JC074]
MITIDWKPDKTLPVKKQIVEYMKERINEGHWPIGSKLPTQRTLAETFGVNRSTIVTALDILKSDGLIEGKGRAGMVVVASTVPLLALSQTRWVNYIEEGIHLPNYKTIKMINDSDPDTTMRRLSSGELSPEIYPKESMGKILQDLSSEIEHLGYEWPTGMVPLREALCEYLSKKNINVKPENILIVSGALQGFQLITMGLLQMGSTVFVEKPSYLYSLQILQTLGMRRMGVSIDEDGLIPDEIVDKIPSNHASILYTIPNFQNPTGFVMSEERRKRLLDICYKSKMPIIEDDVYGDLWLDDQPPASLKSMDKIGNVLYVGSVSKTLSPGLRIGWVVGPETVINRLADIKMQMDYGSSSISQLIVAKYLSSGLYDQHMTYVRQHLRQRLDFTMALLDKYFSDFATWKRPKGGFYIWVDIHKDISMFRVFETAYHKKVLFNPGYIYEAASNHSLRISYSYAPYDELESSIKTLAEIISSSK